MHYKIIFIFLVLLNLAGCFNNVNSELEDKNRIYSLSVVQNRLGDNYEKIISLSLSSDIDYIEKDSVENCTIKTYSDGVSQNTIFDVGDFDIYIKDSQYQMKYYDQYNSLSIDENLDNELIKICKSPSDFTDSDTLFLKFPNFPLLNSINLEGEKILIDKTEGIIIELSESSPETVLTLTIFYQENNINYVKDIYCKYPKDSEYIYITDKVLENLPDSFDMGYLTITNQTIDSNYTTIGVLRYILKNSYTIYFEWL